MKRSILISLFTFQVVFGQVITQPNCQDGLNQAASDIQNNYYHIFNYGLLMYDDVGLQSFYESYLYKVYKVDWEETGCVVEEYHVCYNKKMQSFIDKKFGVDFFERVYEEAKQDYRSYVYKQIDSGHVFSYADSMPSFVGGMDSLYAFLERNINYVHIENDNADEKVFISFVVDTTGYLNNVELVRYRNLERGNEVLKTFEKMPQWNPGFYFGRKAKIQLMLPVSFKNEK